jgi:hypothetical protein
MQRKEMCITKLWRTPLEKRPLGRPKRRWEDNIKIRLEMGCGIAVVSKDTHISGTELSVCATTRKSFIMHICRIRTVDVLAVTCLLYEVQVHRTRQVASIFKILFKFIHIQRPY